MKEYWGGEYNSTQSLTSTLDGGEWSASRTGRFTPKGRTLGTDCVGNTYFEVQPLLVD